MNSAVLEWAETCLRVWGVGAGGRGMTWLGFASRNVIYRIMTEGVGASAPTAPIVYKELPDDILAVAAVIEGFDDDILDAAVQRYVKRNSDRVACRRLNLSRVEYRRRLMCALWFVAGALALHKTLDRTARKELNRCRVGLYR